MADIGRRGFVKGATLGALAFGLFVGATAVVGFFDRHAVEAAAEAA